MKIVSTSRILCGVAAAIVVLAAGGLASAEQTPPHKKPHRQLQAEHPQPQRMTRRARTEALATLFVQLKDAPNEERAELVATAIEKIWRRSGSDTVDLLMERANLALQTQDYDLAIQILTALTKVAPKYAEGWNQLATVRFVREDYQGAMRELRHVLALEPRHFKAIEGMAIILRETGNKPAALKAMRQVLAIYPQMKSAKQAVEELVREVEGQGL